MDTNVDESCNCRRVDDYNKTAYIAVNEMNSQTEEFTGDHWRSSTCKAVFLRGVEVAVGKSGLQLHERMKVARRERVKRKRDEKTRG